MYTYLNHDKYMGKVNAGLHIRNVWVFELTLHVGLPYKVHNVLLATLWIHAIFISMYA